MEQEALRTLNEVLQRQGFIKSFQVLRVIEIAMMCKFDYPTIWKTIEEQLLYNAEYESLRDVLEVLETVKEF